MWTGRCSHPHTGVAPRAVETRSPCSCTERARPLLRLSRPPLRPAGRPWWRYRVSSRGSLSREPFHSEGWSHTCPHQAHSPQARRPARTSHLLGESQNPLPRRSAQRTAAWSRGPSLCPPRGLTLGHRWTAPHPAGVHGGSGPGRRAALSACQEGVASTGLHHTQRVDRFTAVSRDRQGPKPPTGTSTCKSLWQAQPLRLSHARPPDLPTGESGNGLCIFSYQFPGKCLHLQCVQVSQPPEGPRLDLSDSVKAKIPVKTQEADYLQRNLPVSLVLRHL